MQFRNALRVTITFVVVASAALFLFASFIGFGDLTTPSQAQLTNAKVAVIFGGGEGRISSGLRLINSGAIIRLFISGDNLDNHNAFIDFYSWRNPDLLDIKQMLKCCIEWSGKAQNTIENAAETKCWLIKAGVAGPIVLITSQEHIERALLVLSWQLGSRTIIPYPAPDPWHPRSETDRVRAFVVEYAKYVSTMAYYWMLVLQGRSVVSPSFC
jgi:hypothetical protein